MLHAVVLAILLLQASSSGPNESLWEAAREGNTTKIQAALDRGAPVDARARYDMTALLFAADKGHLAAVKLLVARGADVNAQDTFYRNRPLDMALANGHVDVAIFLLQTKSAGADAALGAGIRLDNGALVSAAIATDIGTAVIANALAAARAQKRTALVPLLEAALERRAGAADAAPVRVDPATLAQYAATYRDSNGVEVSLSVREGRLVLDRGGQSQPLTPTGLDAFATASVPGLPVTFATRAGTVESVTIGQGPFRITLPRAAAGAAAPAPAAGPAAARSDPPAVAAAAARASSRHWPMFRGDRGSGHGDGQGLVSEWDVTIGRNIKWKTPIPGIATSSPIVWGDRVLVTTAITKGADTTFRTGLYGDVAPVNDLSAHDWTIYGLDKATGRIVWERTVFTGAPRTKRHTKASHANSTPATDGRHIVAAFGAIGLLVALDMNGRELWRADTGVLDSGWFLDPTYQWGHSSSPILYRDTVILQGDRQKGSYLAAWDLATGKERWRAERSDEISTWGTPAIVRTADGRDELVTNGTKIRGYDPATGALRWTLGPNSEITIATPVAGHGLVFVTGGYPPVRPVYAIRPGAKGDISLAPDATSNAAIAWSNTEGVYIPTPLVYGDHLITLGINGVVTAYDAKTGARAFRGRVGVGGAFSASPVAADGRLFVASEDGEIHVVSAAAGLAPIARSDMKEQVMATPAISDGLLIIRTLGHVYAIGR
jgi:outer membrane protein assembly factor BamB